MTFKDLESILKTLFRDTSHSGSLKHKSSLKNLCLSTLSTQKQPWWKAILLGNFTPQISSGMAVVVLFGAFFGIFQNQSYAGDISPTFGLVEITRDGKTRIIRERTKLKIGDIVQVSSSAQANIALKDKSINSNAMAHTELRIIDKDKIFLTEGTLENVLKHQGEISTKRGKISAENAQGVIKVSETGETKITSTENELTVSDWLDRSTKLNSGEVIKLTTDFNLSNATAQDGQKILTSTEAKQIEAKLLIARTKALNGIEKINIGEREVGRKMIQSAEQSFKGVYSIINRHFSGKKADLEQVKNEDVIEIVLQKTTNEALKTETKAMFTLLEKAKTEGLVFAIGNIQNKQFKRHQIIEQLFEAYAPNQQAEKELLQQAYTNRAQAELAELETINEKKAYISRIPAKTSFRNDLEQVLAAE